MLDRLGQGVQPITCSAGFAVETLVPPPGLIGANGMRHGADGRLYVAQAFGNQISAVDPATGQIDIVVPAGGAIIAPDDLAFDSHGSLYATEVMSARVCALRPNGTIEVIAADTPVANGVTVHADRIFMSEFRPGGRILELFADGGQPRVIAEDLMAPNALCQGPDGKLYFPQVPLGEIWRVAPDGGAPECVARGLATPTAVKVATDGTIIVTEAATGAVSAVDPGTGRAREIARTPIGLDNLALAPDGSVIVSHYTDGAVTTVARDGACATLVPGGMLGPYGLAVDGAGTLLIADGMSLAAWRPGQAVERRAMLLQPGFPAFLRTLAAVADGIVCANSAGMVMHYVPGGGPRTIVEGLGDAMDLAVLPDGAILVCDAGAGQLVHVSAQGDTRILARGLSQPTGLCIGADGTAFVSEAGSGRVVAVQAGEVTPLLEGLAEPHGVATDGRSLYALDRAQRRVHQVDLSTRVAQVVARGVPTGPGPGRTLKPLPGIAGLMPGPLLPFADLALLPDGRLCIGCDGDGSIRALRPL